MRIILVVSLLGLASAMATADEEPIDHGKVALGKSSYRAYCATCHGKEGRGDGPLAEDLRVRPADLTRLTDRRGGPLPWSQVAAIIDGRTATRGHGSSDMPVWGDAFGKVLESGNEATIERKIDELVHFLRSIQQDDPTQQDG